jgi:hypothetical protein
MNTTRPDGESLTVLKSVAHEFEAALIVNALEDHGIRATAAGDFTSGFRAEAPGGVRVLVKSTDVAAALDVLQGAASMAAEERALPTNNWETQAEAEPAKVPGTDVSPELRRAWLAAVGGLVLIPILLTAYSLYLLYRYRLLAGNGLLRNWRAPAALAVNALAILVDCLLVFCS